MTDPGLLAIFVVFVLPAYAVLWMQHKQGFGRV